MRAMGLVPILFCLVPALAGGRGREAPSAQPAPPALEWPSPPAAARLRFITSFTGIPKPGKAGGWRRILKWLLGIDAAQAAQARGLVHPTGLSARGGVIYVADPGRPGVFRYEEAAGRGTWLGTGRSPALASPVAVAAAPDGRLFVADSALGRVFILGPGGKQLGELRGDPEGLGRPVGLALSEDRVFVADVLRHRVAVFDLHGIFLYSFGRRGSDGSGLNFPTYLWYEAGAKRLWVCDSGNFQIRAFDPEGRPLATFGENGDRPGYLARPRGLALDSDGDVYSADGAMEALQIFDTQGRLLLFVGQEGGQPGEFSLPGGIFVDPADRVLVADTYNGRVQLFQYLRPAPAGEKGR